MDIQLSQIVFQIINFGIVVGALSFFVYKPILKTIDERADKIKDGLEAAEKNIKLQSDAEVEKDQIISEAKKEATKIKNAAKSEAEAILSEAQSKAQKESKAYMAKQKDAFAAQMVADGKTLEKKVATLVASATEAVLKDTVGSIKVQQSVIDKQIKDLSAKMLA